MKGFQNGAWNAAVLDIHTKNARFFLELIDNGIEPELAYGPHIKGAALPSSGYDRYRTDFAKGNVWPLLTRLARGSIANTIPSLATRDKP